MAKRHWAFGIVIVAALGAGAVALRISQVARRTAAEAAATPPTFVATERTPVPFAVAEVAYDGALGDGWQDWGWGQHELPKRGPAKVNFAGFSGLALHHRELRKAFGGLAFRYRPPGPMPEFMTVWLRRAGSEANSFPLVQVEPRHVALTEDGWREVLIEWQELNPRNLRIDGVSIGVRTSVGAGWVELDKIVFTQVSADGSSKRNAPAREVNLSASCTEPSRPINPLIYGAAVADWESGQSAQRLGGNPMTRFNWEASVWNAGNDWFFMNGKSGGTLSEWIEAGVAHGATTALVVPMIGWVSKDDTSFSFPKSRFPKQRKFEPNHPEIGDGYSPDGTPIQPGSPTQTSIPAPPDLIGRWVRTLTERDRARGAPGVAMYILDNEPTLWNTTHRDVHPQPLTYDELLDRTIRYATQIRDAAPNALIAGPAEWGWNGYMYSAKDQTSGFLHTDRLAHGNEPLAAWYLKRLWEHEKSTGKRLLDVFDLHFYPAPDGVFGQNQRMDAEGAELRIRSTRALWDPTYTDESWIKEPIRLIPRMKEWVAQNYPGLKTAIGEWNFGGDKHISGALATAEALGRFGQHGLDSAFFWDGPRKDQATFWAFRAFRNFDGKGGRFLDISLPTREAEKVSLFASRDDAGTHVVAIIVNRDPAFAINARIDLGTCGRVISRRIFDYAAGSTSLQEAPESADGAAAARVRAAPYSITVVDLQLEKR